MTLQARRKGNGFDTRPSAAIRVRRTWRSRVALGAALALVPFLSACNTTYERRDWSKYEGPGAEYFQQEELPFPQVDDPLEPVNRISAAIDYGIVRWFFGPVTAVYRNFVPGAVRTSVQRAGENFLYPKRVINNLLQGKWSEAGEESSRFVVNTTVGVLGLFDPALDIGLEPHPEDFGQTFAKWGWKNSTYLFLPLYGPSTVRDGIGLIPDELSDPANYAFPAAWVRRVNKASNEIEVALRLVESNYDAYEPARTLYTLSREVDVSNFSWRTDKSSATQTLESIFLSFEDPTFPGRGRTNRAPLERGEREVPYSVWLQPEPSPLVYVVPGLGGHRVGNATLGLAELAFLNGNSVVAISNPTNWEFIENAATVAVPGYAPADARDLHHALTAIDRDLEARHPGRFTRRHLAGISMGAFQTLFIAAREEEAAAEGLLAFDVYVAMDAPVSLEHGMHQLDAFYNAPLEFAPEVRTRRIEEIYAKVLRLSEGELEPGIELPFTRIEAQYLIGLAFRIDLQYVIVQTQARHDMGILKTPRRFLQLAPVFREASEYSYMEYMHAFVLPYFSARGELTFDEAGARTMFERCDLHSIADGLRANEKVRVFANENDFLLRADDVAWLRELLGDRARFFPAGGHLGNLHRKTIQEIIVSTAEKAAADAEATP